MMLDEISKKYRKAAKKPETPNKYASEYKPKV